MISHLLLNWYQKNKRDLPWRSTDSPYKIWLSEIILQQTRVNQGLEYYNRFVERFPTIQDLADADLDEVLRLWQGLGYYTRARNLHSTAITVVNDHGGIFPASYSQLKQLKGIGPYTAAAVASFAFGEPVALTDGNVFRVISRLFDIDTPINTSAGKKLFLEYAETLLNKDAPDLHNQAIMEFGAIMCTPRNPLCSACVLSANCLALKNNTVQKRPVKIYKVNNRVRYFNYLYLIADGNFFIRKRTEKDIWNSLYEFPLIETTSLAGFSELSGMIPWKPLLEHHNAMRFLGSRSYSHKLSHQLLQCTFFHVESDLKGLPHDDFIAAEPDDLHRYAVPRVIERFLNELHG